MSKKISHDIGRAILLLLPFNVGSCVSLGANHASSYLVYHCRVPRGLCRESAYAYTFVDHMDSGAWNCRLDYRRSGNASVLSTKRRGPISSRRFNRFHPRGDFSPLSLAQVPPASTAHVTKRRRLHSRRRSWRLRSRHSLRGQTRSLYAVQVCAEEGADIGDLRSQPLTAALVDRATHIFAMTGAHLETIQTVFPQGAEKSFLLREFEEPGTTVWRDVPDPIGLGREVYEDCARIISNALPSVLTFVEQSALVPPGAARTGDVYGGGENVDTAEQLAIDRAKRLFGCEHVNVQPHSGAQANMAVYFSMLKPGDKILAMNLAHGGHLTHGHPANFSGKFYAVSQYGVSDKTEQIDYDALQKQAEEVKPAMITAGASAYPRII